MAPRAHLLLDERVRAVKAELKARICRACGSLVPKRGPFDRFRSRTLPAATVPRGLPIRLPRRAELRRSGREHRSARRGRHMPAESVARRRVRATPARDLRLRNPGAIAARVEQARNERGRAAPHRAATIVVSRRRVQHLSRRLERRRSGAGRRARSAGRSSARGPCGPPRSAGATAMTIETLHAALFAVVVFSVLLALVVDVAALLGWVRRRWR